MPNSDCVKVKTALISVSDKTDLLVLAAALKECGVQVIRNLPQLTFLESSFESAKKTSVYMGTSALNMEREESSIEGLCLDGPFNMVQ